MMLRKLTSQTDLFKNKDDSFSKSSNDKAIGEELPPIKRSRKISSGSSLGNLNTLINNFNNSQDASARYNLLCKIYFKVHIKLSKDDLKKDSQESLNQWINESHIEDKIHLFNSQYIQSTLSAIHVIPKNIEKKLIHSLEKINEKIKNISLNSENHKELIKLLDKIQKSIKVYYIAQIKEMSEKLKTERDPMDGFIMTYNLINSAIELKNHISEIVGHLKKDDIKELQEAFINCDIIIELAVKAIKTNKYLELLKHEFQHQGKLSPKTSKFFRRLSSAEFGAFQTQEHNNIKTDYEIKHLGGNTYPVYSINDGKDQFTVKIYAYDDAYQSTYNTSLRIRDKLGKSAQKIIGKTYMQREFFAFVEENGKMIANPLGRLEIAEFFAGGHLGKRIEKAKKGEQAITTDDVCHYTAHIMSIMEKLEKLKIAFPDAKPSNFFVTADNDLRIPDYKTLLECNDLRKVSLSEFPIANTTQAYWPPEMDMVNINSQDTCVDLLAMQKYAIGLTLYELATGDEDYKLDKKNKSLQFNHPIFSGEKGSKLLSVIKSLMDDKPENRMEFKAALQALTDKRERRDIANGYTATRRGSLDSLSPHAIHTFLNDMNGKSEKNGKEEKKAANGKQEKAKSQAFLRRPTINPDSFVDPTKSLPGFKNKRN